jgi:predicted DNA-binding transcriptional regulator AlpA
MKQHDSFDDPSSVPNDEPAGRPIPSDAEALLFQAEAAHLLGLSPRTMEAFRVKGGGPIFYSIGRRAVRYRRADVIAWREACRRKSTSDPGPSALEKSEVRP